MLETPDKLELLSLIDILVDGRYDKSKRNLMLQFRGSSNQRIIDVQKSLKSGQIVIWDKLNDGKESMNRWREWRKMINRKLVSEIETGKVKTLGSTVIRQVNLRSGIISSTRFYTVNLLETDPISLQNVTW